MLVIFRSLEALYETTPPYVIASTSCSNGDEKVWKGMIRYVAYMTSPVEFEFNPSEQAASSGQFLIRTTTHDQITKFFRFVISFEQATFMFSWLESCQYQPFPSVEVTALSSWNIFYWGNLLNNLVVSCTLDPFQSLLRICFLICAQLDSLAVLHHIPIQTFRPICYLPRSRLAFDQIPGDLH